MVALLKFFKKLIVLSIGVFSFFVLDACTKDKSEAVLESNKGNSSLETYCDTVIVSFSTQIQPLFVQSCATSNCHDVASSSAGYVLENYSQISASASVSLKTMRHDAGVSAMPKFSAKLSDSLIQQLECWISQGKLNN